MNDIQGNSVGLLSLHYNIDTITPQGKLTIHIFAAIAEFEREIIRELINAGLATVRNRGRKPRPINSRKIKAEAAQHLNEKGFPVMRSPASQAVPSGIKNNPKNKQDCNLDAKSFGVQIALKF